jgi:hypothetical protein
MPKPVKKAVRKLKTPPKPKRPSDPNRAAHSMITEHLARMAGPTPDDFGTQLSTYMSELGRKGGKIGGKRRLETMSDTERSAAASRAAKARWGRPRGKAGK